MTQNTEQNVRTFNTQISMMAEFIRTGPSGKGLEGWLSAHIRSAEARGAAEERAKGEKALEEALTERDDAEDYVLKLAEEVLGREVEWSNGYDFQSALNDVSEYTADLEKKGRQHHRAGSRTRQMEVTGAVRN